MATTLADLWKIGTTTPGADDMVVGGLAIDVFTGVVWSKDQFNIPFVVGGGTTPPPAPVDSVNGETGVVVLNADHVGAAWEHHGHAMSEIANLAAEFLKHYQKTEHVASSSGANEAGKPVILDGFGKLDPSFLSTNSFYYVTAFTPILATEYPDPAGETHGAFWVIQNVAVEGYTYTTGDLIGQVGTNGDFMMWGTAGWSIIAGEMNPTLYYLLDGSVAIEANLNCGTTWKVSSMADGTLPDDAASFGQLTSLDARVVANANQIAINVQGIADNAAAILVNANAILLNEGNIADNVLAIGNNASNITLLQDDIIRIDAAISNLQTNSVTFTDINDDIMILGTYPTAP